MRTKLFREINDVEVSEPGTLALFAIGLAGLAATRRKKA
ncbi:PEP-CTERM sorting domain-containing protein [Oleiphilus sp. HI0125]